MLSQIAYVYRSCLDREKPTVTRFIGKIVVTVGCAYEYACSSYFNFLTPKSWPIVLSKARNKRLDGFNFSLPFEIQFSEFNAPFAF